MLLILNFTDGASGNSCIPLITPSNLLLSTKGKVKLCQNMMQIGCSMPTHLSSYLAPEYRPNRGWSDTELEKVK